MEPVYSLLPIEQSGSVHVRSAETGRTQMAHLPRSVQQGICGQRTDPLMISTESSLCDRGLTPPCWLYPYCHGKLPVTQSDNRMWASDHMITVAASNMIGKPKRFLKGLAEMGQRPHLAGDTCLTLSPSRYLPFLPISLQSRPPTASLISVPVLL